MRGSAQGRATPTPSRPPRDELQTALQRVSEELYQQAAAPDRRAPSGRSGPGAPEAPRRPEPKKAEGEVIDADFEVVDEDKK